MAIKKHFWIAVSLMIFLGACAPQATQTQPTTITLESPEAVATNRLALQAWHRMELARLQMGEYTTNALVDLELPQGVQWTVEGFSGSSYTLRFSSSNVPDLVWFITPEGVTVRSAQG